MPPDTANEGRSHDPDGETGADDEEDAEGKWLWRPGAPLAPKAPVSAQAGSEAPESDESADSGSANNADSEDDDDDEDEVQSMRAGPWWPGPAAAADGARGDHSGEKAPAPAAGVGAASRRRVDAGAWFLLCQS